MSEAQQPSQVTEPNRPRRIVRSILWILGLFILSLVLVLGYMFSTDRGSKFLLDRVLEQQNMIQYKYEQGNLLNGIVLKDVLVNLASVDVEIGHAEVVLGWRAILSKEIHLNELNTENLIVRLKGEPAPEDTPFGFPQIKLLFVLRVDEANVDHLTIITKGKTEVDFYHIYLNDTVWKDSKIDFVDISMDMGYLNVRDATGFIDFKDKYPLALDAKLNLPSLRDSINIHDIHVIAKGSLDTIETGFAAETPDILRGWGVVRPMIQMVPMFGQLKFNQYHLPFLTEHKLYIDQGKIDFKGTYQGFDLFVNTDLEGENIPKGRYDGEMYVDFVNALNIQRLDANLMEGQLRVAGRLDWSEIFNWDVWGRVSGIDPKHERIPEALQAFLPPKMDGAIQSQGTFAEGLHLTANVDFDQYETWQVKLDQKPVVDKPQPMLLGVKWQNIDRAVPYIGWLKSESGQADLVLSEQKQEIQVSTTVGRNEQALLPAGTYQARLDIQDNNIRVPQFSYAAGQGQLTGQAFVELPTEKRLLAWKVALDAKQFNPQSISPAAPVDLLTGHVDASGKASENQHHIELKNIALLGRIAGQKETVRLTGQSNADLFFKPVSQGGGLSHYQAKYDGALKSTQFEAGDGLLKIDVKGNTDLLQISQFKHSGAAGRIDANGVLDLRQGLAWKANAAFIRFKPQYFVSRLKGEVSGNIVTQGAWSDQLKQINLTGLNVAGMLNNKPLRAKGDLALVLDPTLNSFIPKKFSANSLLLSYANNRVQVTGNQQRLDLKLDAQRLHELYPGLVGKAQGYIHVRAEPRLTATANMQLNGFAYGDLISIQNAKITGQLPTSDSVATKLVGTLTGLRSGDHEIQEGVLELKGTYGAHVLSVDATNQKSKFYVQLAGGFKNNGAWYGQIQRGDFNSERTRLVQRQNASVIYQPQQSSFYVSAHCWMSQQNEICADQPIQINANGGSVSLVSRDIDLSDFVAFMPEGLRITGKLNGHAKANWKKGAKPLIDLNLITRNGTIGLTDDQGAETATNLSYKRVELVAKSVAAGLKLRLDLETQNIGRGYANVDINPYVDRMPINGVVAFDGIDLQVFKPFIADVRKLAGNLSYTGRIGGYLTAPELTGQLRLKDGAISMMSMPVNLNNIQMYVKSSGSRAEISSTFNSGTGQGTLNGFADWRNDPQISLNLKGKELQLRQVPLFNAWATPDLNVTIKPTEKSVQVNGTVSVPRANIFMPETTASVVNTSADVRVVHTDRNRLEILKSARPWNVNAKIFATIGPEKVYFNGFNSRIPLAGRLDLEQRGLESAMRATGIVGMRLPTQIEAYGQSLTIQRAIARFNGALVNPSLDIDANKTVQGVQVGVRITGGASNANVDPYGEGLSDQEALNALLTGRIDEGGSNINQTEGFKSDVSNTIAAAGISMGLGGTRALTNQIGRSLGLKGLALDAQGTGDDTQVSVTGYITPDLFIRYGIGVFTPVNKLTLRYQMNKRLYLEASQSLERAIDVFYNWRF